jgi:cell division septum initiation protein DivIVA
MTDTTTPTEAAEDLRARIETFEAKVKEFDGALSTVAYAATVKCDGAAIKRQAELLAARRDAEDHLDLLRRALTDAERRIVAEQDAITQAQRDAALERAAAERKRMVSAAKAIDKAMSMLESAYGKFETARRNHDQARRDAGERVARRYGPVLLRVAAHAQMPEIARMFNIERPVGPKRRPLREQVDA